MLVGAAGAAIARVVIAATYDVGVDVFGVRFALLVAEAPALDCVEPPDGAPGVGWLCTPP